MLVSISENERDSIFALMTDSQKRDLKKNLNSLADDYIAKRHEIMDSLEMPATKEDFNKTLFEFYSLCLRSLVGLGNA